MATPIPRFRNKKLRHAALRLQSEDPHERLEAASTLEQHGSDLDVLEDDPDVSAIITVLLAALNDTDPDVLVAVLKALVEFNEAVGDPDFWDDAVAHLVRLSEHRQVCVREQTLDAMVTLCVPEVLPLLVREAESAKPRKRHIAIIYLAEFEYDRWEELDLYQQAETVLVKALQDSHIKVRIMAAKALYKWGKKCNRTLVVPALRAAIHDKSTAVRIEVIQALANIDRENPEMILLLRDLYRDPNAKVRREAVRKSQGCVNVLEQLPPMLDLLDDNSPMVREAVSYTCRFLGKVTAPMLRERLRHSSARVRFEAANALFNQPEFPPETAVALLEALAIERTPRGIERLLWVLRVYGETAAAGHATIARWLRSKSPAIRKQAAETLLYLAKHPEIPAELRKVHEDRTIDLPPETREAIAQQMMSEADARADRIRQVRERSDWEALQSLHNQKALPADVAVPALLTLLEGADIRTFPSRTRLLDMLREYASAATADLAVPRLRVLLDLVPLRKRLLKFLVESEDDSPDLEQLMSESEAGYRIGLASLLYTLEPDERLLQLFIDLAGTKHDIIVQTALCHAWFFIGPPARSDMVSYYLVDILQYTRSYDEAWAATDALVSMGWVPDEMIHTLAGLLGRHSQAGWAARVLKAVGPLLVEPVIEALQQDSHLSREFAADVLASYGPAARAAVPILRDYRAQGDENPRIWSTIALARIEPDPSLVEPLLDLAEQHSNTTIRCRALQALGGCVALSPRCRECLERALRDPEEQVQATARAVLESQQT